MTKRNKFIWPGLLWLILGFGVALLISKLFAFSNQWLIGACVWESLFYVGVSCDSAKEKSFTHSVGTAIRVLLVILLPVLGVISLVDRFAFEESFTWWPYFQAIGWVFWVGTTWSCFLASMSVLDDSEPIKSFRRFGYTVSSGLVCFSVLIWLCYGVSLVRGGVVTLEYYGLVFLLATIFAGLVYSMTRSSDEVTKEKQSEERTELFQKMMGEAISQERYEDAAVLKQELEKIAVASGELNSFDDLVEEDSTSLNAFDDLL